MKHRIRIGLSFDVEVGEEGFDHADTNKILNTAGDIMKANFGDNGMITILSDEEIEKIKGQESTNASTQKEG